MTSEKALSKIRRTFRRISRERTTSQREKETRNTKDRHPSGSILAGTRLCVEALRPLAGTVPGLGYQIQALLDIGMSVINKIQQFQTLHTVKLQLCRKIEHVFGMIGTALEHECVKATPGLEEDLRYILEQRDEEK